LSTNGGYQKHIYLQLRYLLCQDAQHTQTGYRHPVQVANRLKKSAMQVESKGFEWWMLTTQSPKDLQKTKKPVDFRTYSRAWLPIII